MSHFTMMSSQQRKMQAAAICREIQGSNDGAVDVGRKVSAPKEIMLEELSLSSNRGSRLFKMRQRRSEKYTFESVQSEDGMRTQNGVAVQTQHAEKVKSDTNGTAVGQLPKATLEPEPGTAPDPENIAPGMKQRSVDLESFIGTLAGNVETAAYYDEAEPFFFSGHRCIWVPGYGGPLKDVPPEKFNSTAVPRSYCSPWDQALLSDPTLAEALLTTCPVPEARSEIPEYKSFNRVATPFGGFDKAPRIPTHKPVQTDLLLDVGVVPCPEVQDTVGIRPTFNRTAMGWIADTAPPIMPTVILEPMSIPESDDL